MYYPVHFPVCVRCCMFKAYMYLIIYFYSSGFYTFFHYDANHVLSGQIVLESMVKGKLIKVSSARHFRRKLVDTLYLFTSL